MSLIPTLLDLLGRASRALGLETIDSFPPGHAYARTRWDRAYFDIASDMKPDQIERALCESITNTPSVFAHIVNPTPGMQRALLAVIHTRLRRACGAPNDLLKLLIDAYDSPHTVEAIPGLRAAIARSEGLAPAERAHALLAHLGAMPAAFDVIDAPARIVN
ncbi:hypothetical protein [Massilia horti]|uniref:hypothetical protein n=1 Tax=Massilia horti TaxID=2562153 RepID=UPI00197DFCC7|nr:hypothetical protein [Massilia horti]